MFSWHFFLLHRNNKHSRSATSSRAATIRTVIKNLNLYAMIFESGGIYHIYNQGNNRQVIFYTRDNYLFFLQKVKSQIGPYGNILAWCMMPNHFHLMMEVTDPSISRGATSSRTPTSPNDRQLSLNDSIGILLSSYTRAINIQENTTGSLFRQKTKAICLNEINGISSNWFTSFGVTFMNVMIPEFQYPQVCFNYIHNNPVKAGLVEKPEEWEFSSYLDLKSLRNGKLVDKERVAELGLII
jgi:putative transposase